MKKHIAYITLFLIASCTDRPAKKLNNEHPFNGQITYEISYPYNQNDSFLNLYPTELIAKITDTLIHTSINDIGISIDTYLNTKDLEINQYIEIAIPHKKLHVHLNKEDIKDFINKSPKYTFNETTSYDSLDQCKIEKIIAKPNNSSNNKELWATKDIDFKAFNYFGPFSSVNQTLLIFETTNLGFTTRLKATKIEPQTIDIKIPTDKEGFQTTTLDSLDIIIANIFGIKK